MQNKIKVKTLKKQIYFKGITLKVLLADYNVDKFDLNRNLPIIEVTDTDNN